MRIYYIKTFGNEDNFFQTIVNQYTYSQYLEVKESLKDNNIDFEAWSELI